VKYNCINKKSKFNF